MPTSRCDADNSLKGSWQYKLAPYYGDSLEGKNAAAIAKTGMGKVVCPSHTKTASENYYGLIFTYAVNIAASGYPWADGYGVCADWSGGVKSRLGSSIPDSSGTLMIIESYNSYAYPASVGQATNVINRHGDRCNITFVDGHVESEDIIKYHASNTKGMWTIVSGD